MKRESPTTGEDRGPLRLWGLYIHVPFCLSKCRYCTFYSERVPGGDTLSLFVRAVLRELEEFKGIIRAPYTLYIGGGTPTVMDKQLLRLIEGVLYLMGEMPVEFSVEANPATFNRDLLRSLRELGVTRLSIGVQSLNDETLSFLGRPHSSSQALSALDAALSVFEEVNADIIFAVPGQSLRGLEETLRRVARSGVTHISAYGLSVEPPSELHRLVASGRVKEVDGELFSRMFNLVHEFLTGEGFHHYEISNYAKGKRCLHNLIYWCRRPYVGLGPSAASFVGRTRWRNPPNLGLYLQGALEGRLPREKERIDERTSCTEMLMLYLRLASGIHTRKLRGCPGAKERLERAQSAGLLEAPSPGRFRIPHSLWPVSNSIISELLP